MLYEVCLLHLACLFAMILLLDRCSIDGVIVYMLFFFLMIRRPPRSTQSRSSAASDVYKRQVVDLFKVCIISHRFNAIRLGDNIVVAGHHHDRPAVSYTHLRAHETVLDLVCRLLLEKKKKNTQRKISLRAIYNTQRNRQKHMHQNKNNYNHNRN